MEMFAFGLTWEWQKEQWEEKDMVNLKLEQTLTEFCNTKYLSKYDEENRMITYFENHENVFQYKCLFHKQCVFEITRRVMK